MRAYAKTGTSSDSNDLWMVAGTPYYVGSVWYGFDKQQTIPSTSSAAVIWRDIMKAVHKDLEPKDFTYSENVYKKGVGYYKNGTSPDNYGTIMGENTETSSTASQVSASSQSTSSVTSKVSSSAPTQSTQSSVSTPHQNTTSEGTSTSAPTGTSEAKPPAEPETGVESSAASQTPSSAVTAPAGTESE